MQDSPKHLPPTHPSVERRLPGKLANWLPFLRHEAKVEELITSVADDSTLPRTFLEINALPSAQKHAIYRALLPDVLLERYQIDPITLSRDGEPLVFFSCPEGSFSLEAAIWRSTTDRDPVTYVHLADGTNYQVRVLFVQYNDPESPRFDTDMTPDGEPTYFGTLRRNIDAERAALVAGLAPGRVRKGLALFREFLPNFERFVGRMGHEMYFLEPLAYHTAILFERMGFGYVQGQKEMETIHQGFQPGGALHAQLTTTSPFRGKEAWRTVRGRSWAIHDGILGRAYDGIEMYKQLGKGLGVDTAPGVAW